MAKSKLQSKAERLLNENWLYRLALAAIVAAAGILRFANLQALGYANHYYTAAVVSMLQSWRNFFFVAAEPGGSVSIDKPPVGLWLQTISARIFGISGFGVLVPEILAGILSVIVVYHLVQRKFGKVAGLLAGLALAITPVVVATERNNTMDSTLILTLLLAAWAFIKATETARLRYLLLGAALVGIGFNIKMLQAYLPLPAFYALYFLGSADSIKSKLGKLSLATMLLLAISLSWATVVDLTPASQRPYVGSSSDNSELSLIFGYNGIQRLIGMGGRGGLLSGILPSSTGASTNSTLPGPQAQDGNAPFQPPQDGNSGFSSWPEGNGAFQPPQGPAGAGGPGGSNGMFNTGQPGLWRLFIAPLSNQMSWLLPFGILSGVLLALRSRLHWPLTEKHKALVLWGGWLLIGGAFFSVAGFFHEYYLSMLAPALAALVGIGVVELWAWREKRRWLASAVLFLGAVVTLFFQYRTAATFVSSVWWMPVIVGLYLVGAALVFVAAFRRIRTPALVGFICLVAALLVTPGIWSALTTLDSSTNQTLPAAYNGGQASFGPVGQGGTNTNLTGLQVDQALLSYLEANTQGTKYLMAVPSAMQGADYVIATGRPVLYLGGFNGQDRVETVDSLAQLVDNGELKFVYWGGGGGPGGASQSDISSWVTSNGTAVTGFETTSQNFGAPDGTTTTGVASDGGSLRGLGGGMQVALYELDGGD